MKGPSTIQVTALVNRKTCSGCEWFVADYKKARGEGNPKYRTSCIHPEILNARMPSMTPRLTGNLDNYYNYTHHFPETPEWCPVLKKEEA